MNCKQQWDHYRSEKSRVQQLAKELGPVAAQCTASHSHYDEMLAKRQAAEKSREACRQTILSWKSRHETWQKCQDYLASKKAYDLYVQQAERQYELTLQAYQQAKTKYDVDYANWVSRSRSYSAYQNSLNALASSVRATWAGIQNKYPHLKNYENYRQRTICGVISVPCVSQADKERWALECTVIKGLGSRAGTPTSTTSTSRAGTSINRESGKCQWIYMPTCPPQSRCPTPVSPPGSKPTKPLPPREPEIIPLEEWLSKRGISVPDQCPAPDPGPKPTCNPNKPLPEVPPKPTCTPPKIPGAPSPPACEEPTDLFAGVGNMWLLLAAGGAGLYWLTRKK